MRTKMRYKIAALMLPLILAGVTGGGATQSAAQEAATQTSRVITGNYTIDTGEVVDEIVVIGGDLRIRGEVSEDAVVIGGNLILEESAAVLGDAVVTGGRVINEGGRVRGELRTIEGLGLEVAEEIERALGNGATSVSVTTRNSDSEVRSSARQESRRSQRSWFDPIRRGVAGIMSTIALGLVLAGIGTAIIFFGRPYLETASDTVLGAGLRSGATGLAACFLAVPAFIVLIVTLAVSIIGIPFLLVAIPLYPLALFSAAVFGLLAAAHAIGERTAERSREGIDFRHRNSYAYLATGLGMMLTPLIAADLIAMTGFLGFIGTLLKIVTWTVIWAASTIGFGAVILSRAGTRRTFVAPIPDVGIDTDDFFMDQPVGNQDDV